MLFPALVADLRFGLRMLHRERTLTLPAVLTLALGIGATTATFSVAHAVILRPLPFADPDRLVVLWEQDLRRNQPVKEVSYRNAMDWDAQSRAFVVDDDRPGARPVVVLSHRLWQRRFGGDPSSVGKSLELIEQGTGTVATMHTIVGVMPREFDFPREPSSGCRSRRSSMRRPIS